jgi:hypothetical protein
MAYNRSAGYSSDVCGGCLSTYGTVRPSVANGMEKMGVPWWLPMRTLSARNSYGADVASGGSACSVARQTDALVTSDKLEGAARGP